MQGFAVHVLGFGVPPAFFVRMDPRKISMTFNLSSGGSELKRSAA